jgi:hypothetical protein
MSAEGREIAGKSTAVTDRRYNGYNEMRVLQT